ncbi:MAG: Hsp20 family protein, partial [Rickettsia endosymbiont of Ixodes persulcatus]|nr:Hsp20 family protein [Rickettsia endosymbiont of Ixodes persulcatus]
HKLFIEGKIDDSKENNATNYLNKNFNYVMSLYDDIDQKTISSKLKNGILSIKIPKKEQSKAKKITQLCKESRCGSTII